MSTSDTISKENKLSPAEDYNKLRREGILHFEKLAGNVWTDYNTHDPGITMLEALCYAITDLAYRTGFDMKDLLAQKIWNHDSWKNIFYTAREILPCNPLTINDYRKLIVDVEGVRNAWVTVSKDYEAPVYINYKKINDYFDDPEYVKNHSCGCETKTKLLFTGFPGLHFDFKEGDSVVELNGLYKIIVEYEEEITEKKKEDNVRTIILQQLHNHRSLCEDFLSVAAAEYKTFFMRTQVVLTESADPEMVLAEMCYLIQNYFTPPIKFYTLDEMVDLGKTGDEIFEGPALKHGFILDSELEETDMFRDMRLSDIINFISDIEGINALDSFMIFDAVSDADDSDPCADKKFFEEWIDRMQQEKLVGRLSIDDILKFFHPGEEDLDTAKSSIQFTKPSGDVTINTDRFQKLLNDLKGKDKYMKLSGFVNNFPVPTGEDMELSDFYPVQYELPFTYRVGKNELPLRDGKLRLIQALQLKGYLAVFEQLFLNYMYQLGDLNEFFSFRDIQFKGKTKHTQMKSACDPVDQQPPPPAKWEESLPNQIIYKDQQNVIHEKIDGYICLYYDAEKYLSELQSIIQPEAEFEWQRNLILDHLLARFGEEMSEYLSLIKNMYPNDYLLRIIKNKTDLLSDYPAISNNRGKGYNYKLREEAIDDEMVTWDEDEIALNISGLEKRIARLIGMPNYKRKYLSPDNLYVEVIKDPLGAEPDKIKVVLYEDETLENILLETPVADAKCADDITHCFIDSGCCGNNFIKYPEQRGPHHRQHQHQHHQEYKFVLRDAEGKDLATSPAYRTPELRDEAMKKAKCALEKICLGEGFHMIEHILLRAKGDFSVEDTTTTPTSFINYELLDICLDKCDVGKEPDKPSDIVIYRFDIRVLPPEKCLGGKRWVVELVKNKDEIILSATFKEYELASTFISALREYGSEVENFIIYKTKTGNKFYFKIKDENGTTLAESSCFSKFSTTPGTIEKATPGNRTLCDITIIGGIVEEISALNKFLAYELDLYCCEDPCKNNEDPYSFLITFVLPCWPKRFRNKGFRKFVEKTIYSETPAHIQANIFWVGIEQMRNYEDAYFEWLIEMAANDVPDISICNEFIKNVKSLENCDEECDEENDKSKANKPGDNKKLLRKKVK